jgi:acyl-CoA thioester hydrolase
MKYFDCEYRVRYSDTDKMGVSYYANYLLWFEAARTEYFRALGYPYTECEAQGYFLPVAETGVHYHAPSTYDDLLVIRTSVSRVRRTSLRFEYQVFKKENPEPIATGFTVHVFVDGRLKPARIPATVLARITPHVLLDS